MEGNFQKASIFLGKKLGSVGIFTPLEHLKGAPGILEMTMCLVFLFQDI